VYTGRVALLLVSLLVFGTTGFAWSTYKDWGEGFTRDDVIGRQEELPTDGATDILLVGSDSRTDAQGNPLPENVLRELRAGADEGDLTDTLILLRVPNDGTRAIGISFPRDSYVEIPGGYGKHKINSAFKRAKYDTKATLTREGGKDEATIEREANLAGRRKLIETIESLTGITIDHFAEVNLLGFYEITKAVGGVEVCLKHDTADRDSGANFKAGRQTVMGADALAFVRQRKNLPRSDLDRIVRQQVFMAGLARKMLSTGVLTDTRRLNDMITALQRSVVLDAGWDLLAFAQQMRGVAGGNIEFHTIPTGRPNLPTPDGQAVEVDPAEVKRFVNQVINPAGTDSTAPAPEEGNSAITVDVRNASGVSGLAARVMEQLGDTGFTKGETGNAASRRTSVVRHAQGEEEAGKKVAAALDGLPVEPDSNIPSGHVWVYLGKDYAGPGSQNLGAPGVVALDGAVPQRGPYLGQTGSEPVINADDVPCVN